MTEKNPFFGATFAERKAAREQAEQPSPGELEKAVTPEADEVEDKAVAPKRTRKKSTI